jgi:hypothetical protein
VAQAVTTGEPELDPVIHAPSRLRIMAALAILADGDSLSFTRLQNLLGERRSSSIRPCSGNCWSRAPGPDG